MACVDVVLRMKCATARATDLSRKQSGAFGKERATHTSGWQRFSVASSAT
jgi:hypothetical protein